MNTKNKSKPNVVVFFTDQQRWDTSGLHGNPLDLMPNFDAMAMNGTHFYNTLTCQPVCGPARSSLQTGKFATETGVFVNCIPLKEDETTIAKCFKNAGYQTGYIGKWHLGGMDPAITGGQLPIPVEKRGGYDYWLAADLTEFISDSYNTVLFDNDGNEVKLPGYRVDACTDAAIRYIDDNKDDPFFLFLSFLEPHHQNSHDHYPAPDGYAERYTGRWTPPDLTALGGTAPQHLGGYYGMVKRLDEALGRLLDALKSLDLMDNTIVLFTSDHGNHFKTRNSEYKRSCHEACIRVPTALRGPGFDGGGRVQGLVSLVDIAPTLLDAAGIEVPAEMQGNSAMPLLVGETQDWQDDVFIQISESHVGRAIRTSRWKYSVHAPGIDGEKASYSDHYVEEFLYDLYADPYELDNMVQFEAYDEVKRKMRARLLARIKQEEGRDATIEALPYIADDQQRLISDKEAAQ